MKRVNRREPIVKRFCDYMARQHLVAQWIDRVIDWILPPPALRQFAGGPPGYRPAQPDRDPLRPQPMHMSTGPNLDITRRLNTKDVPEGPPVGETDTGNWWDRPGIWDRVWNPNTHRQHKHDYNEAHSKHECADDKYHGMHGRPCKFQGGTDTKCPAGTTSGWFWSYDCPKVGRIFYVDCCGDRAPTSPIWCNWTVEADWCVSLPWGRFRNSLPAGTDPDGHYFCTLAIPDALMRTKDLGGGKYEVDGVDP